MTDEIEILAKEFLKLAYPIKKMKVKHKALVRHNLPSLGKFKKVIFINDTNVYQISNKGERYNAMHALSRILIRIFKINQTDSIKIIKEHLHINDSDDD